MQIMKKLGIWLLSGFALVAGGYLAMVAFGLAPAKQNYVELPSDLKIHDLKSSPLTEQLTVIGRITNSSTKTYRPVFVDLDISNGGALLLRCRQSDMSFVPPKSTIDFQMSCPEVKTNKLPQGASFHATVNSASFKGSGT